MISYKYAKDWSSALDNEVNLFSDNRALSICAALQTIAQKNSTQYETLPAFMKTITQFILNNFDVDNTLFGFFQLMKLSDNHQISPFIATHDYCIKILSITPEGRVTLNISPIYHLGPDYPEYYEKKQGKKLNQEAIIGLLTSTSHSEAPCKFNLGIDAGIAFNQNPSSHNKKMNLDIRLVDEGILATLSSEGHTTSKVFTWDHLGMPSALYSDLYTQNIQDIWAA